MDGVGHHEGARARGHLRLHQRLSEPELEQDGRHVHAAGGGGAETEPKTTVTARRGRRPPCGSEGYIILKDVKTAARRIKSPGTESPHPQGPPLTARNARLLLPAALPGNEQVEHAQGDQ